MAFEGISEKLQNIFKGLKSKGRLTEADVKTALREVKMALLEADVNFRVVKQFVKSVEERAIGQDVMNSLTPGQTVIKIVNEELVKLMGSEPVRLPLRSGLNVLMMVGLNGAGKTTMSAKLGGELKVLCVNTLGVLYLVTSDGSEITSFEDLRGKTVYAPAQNPTFIFSYLCKANGLEPGTDVIIDNAYAQPADLRTAVAAGEVAIAVLPEPMVTIAKSSSETVSVQMDLTEQWDMVAPAGSLVQGCVVARTEFASAYPDAIAAFLGEYEKSIAFLSEDAQAAGAVIEQTGVFAKGTVAAKALPNCNVCFVTGEEMKETLAQFLSIMAEAAPASIGGAVPADSFYYIP